MLLKPFDPNAVCPTCNHDLIRVLYCPGSDRIAVKSVCQVDDVRVEHLHRRCEGCGEEWLERTALNTKDTP